MWRDLKDLSSWCKKNIFPYFKQALSYLRSSWKSFVFILPCLVLLYYGLGSIFSENIDKNLQFIAPKAPKNDAIRSTISNLIAREIDEHMYTPNLPFFFPAYILDNMPAYQSGIILSLSDILHAIAFQSTDENLKKADELLSYPLNVWLFSKTKDFKIEPSSTAQYRKAKQFLLKTKPEEINRPDVCLTAIEQNLLLTEKELLEALQSETGGSDEIFFRAQGRLYTDYMLLKAVEKDNEIFLENVYKPLIKAILLEPLFVQNGRFGSSFLPNHLLELAYLTLKSANALEKVRQDYVHRN